MSVVSSSLTGGAVTIQGSTKAVIYNLSCLLANTEYSQALSPNTKQLLIRSRNGSKLQFSFVLGESGTKYITIKHDSVYSESNLSLTGETLYIQSSNASEVVEILEWS